MGLLDEIDKLSKSQDCSQAGPSRKKTEQPMQINRSKSKNLENEEIDDILDIEMMSASQSQRRQRSHSKHLQDDSTSLNPLQVQKMSIEKLRQTVSRFGFRPSKSRSVMIDQLGKVYEALKEKEQGQQEVGDSSSVFSSSPPSSFLLQPLPTPPTRNAPKKKNDNKRQSDVINLDSDISVDIQSQSDSDLPLEMGYLTMAMMQEQKQAEDRNRARSDDEERDSQSDEGNNFSSGDDDEEEDVGNTSLRGAIRSSTTTSSQEALGTVPAEVAKQLHDIIQSDEDLYRRILLFEPISFDEVNSLAKKAGIQGLRNKETLRNWLDVQCICFYSTELTGRRQRY